MSAVAAGEPGGLHPSEDGGLPGAVLFDMDGLLVDSEPVWTIAERAIAESLGGVFTPEIKAAMVGRHVDVAVPVMLRMLGVVGANPAAVAERLLARTVELFTEDGRLVPQPGAFELLAALAAAGVPTALVSASIRPLVDAVLAVVGRDVFAATVAGDEVARTKPDPEGYLTAAARLGVPPGECVVLEDTPTGARAGLAAGCPTILVPSVAAGPAPSGAVLRTSLREVDLPLLASLTAAARTRTG